MEIYDYEVSYRLKAFSLERWQSERENKAKILLSESGAYPLTLRELGEILGFELEISNIRLGYGWTRGSSFLRERISSIYEGDVREDNIVVTNGSAEANFLTVLSLLKPGDRVVVEMPNYMQVKGLVEWVGARASTIWRKPPYWELDLNELANMVEEFKPKALFITNPNNPTGRVLRENVLAEIVEITERTRTFLVFDEVYKGLELWEDKETPSIIDVSGTDRAASIHGLSKAYGLPGLRVGWVATNDKLATRIWSIKDYTSIAPSIISDHIASIILEPRFRAKILDKNRSVLRENFRTAEHSIPRELVGSGFEVLKPEAGGFFLLKTPLTETMTICENILKRYNILVNPGECFEIPGYIRVGLGDDPREYHYKIISFYKALIEEFKRVEGSNI